MIDLNFLHLLLPPAADFNTCGNGPVDSMFVRKPIQSKSPGCNAHGVLVDESGTQITQNS